jgi:hypothetical protein
MYMNHWHENCRESENLGDLGTDERVILELALTEYIDCVCSGHNQRESYCVNGNDSMGSI